MNNLDALAQTEQIINRAYDRRKRLRQRRREMSVALGWAAVLLFMVGAWMLLLFATFDWSLSTAEVVSVAAVFAVASVLFGWSLAWLNGGPA